jgi:translation initiation factor IF-3
MQNAVNNKGKEEYLINRKIKTDKVRVVNSETKGLTTMTLDEAIELAESTDEDVVLINGGDYPPIVKICDYNKMIYEKQKKEKDNKKKQRLKQQDIKEIQLRDSIAEHDVQTKVKSIVRILKEGDIVKISIVYKGRSARFVSEGIEKLNNIEKQITVSHKVDKQPKIEGNRVTMTINPTFE